MRLVSFRTEVAGSDRVGRLDGDIVVELTAPSMISWLNGEGREASGSHYEARTVLLQAPVPVPSAYLDFMTYKGHAQAALGAVSAGGFEVPPYWYEFPAFYYGNTQSFVGPGSEVRRPPEVEWLDFELEIAAVIDGTGDIAGFTILNDWSARDIQRREATVGLGVHKSKDFAYSLGPWLVTPDELDYRDGKLHLEATAQVNGQTVAETDTVDQYFAWPQIVEHAARNTRLPAGAVLGSGTMCGGSLVEHGAIEQGNWLQPGDVVTLTASGLGSLTSTIA
jgi:fumarylacetoacetate (FAA) hydrolase